MNEIFRTTQIDQLSKLCFWLTQWHMTWVTTHLILSLIIKHTLKISLFTFHNGNLYYIFASQISLPSVQFSSVQSLSRVQLFATPWTAACQDSLSITNFRRLLKLMSIESVILSNHLILCHPLLLVPSVFPSIRVCIRWPKYQSFQWIFRNDFL